MAINRISGDILEANLIRSTDLAFNTNLLYVDVTNGRIGVKTDSPGNFALDVNGNTRISGNQTITGDLTVQGTTTTIDSQNLVVEDNIITINENASSATDAGIMIQRAGENEAVLYWDETTDKFRVGTTPEDGSTRTDFTNVTLANLQAADPTADADVATKSYVDSQISAGGVTADNVELRLPTDSTFGDGAYLGLTSSTSVTNAIDEINEVLGNVQAGTYIKSVSFVADSTSISAGDTVTLTITTTPTAGANTRYTITWGDGNTDTASSDSTPSHTYASGGTFSVTVKAFENDAGTTDSAGSFATSTRSNYIVASTAEPSLTFAMYAASSGGSPITKADNGATVYLQNNCTNTSGATVTYDVDWGDGGNQTISGDNGVAGGSSANGGTRLAHTYTNSAGDDGSTVAGTGAGDTKYAIRLRLLTHSTANPSVIPKTATNNFEVYSTHTPLYSVADSTIRGVNEESTSGFPVTFTNNTATNPGANSSFSATQQYTWNFGEGDSNTVVAVGSGSSGDTGQTINNTFNLTSGQQSGGTTVTYNTTLSLATGHSTTPFTSGLNIIVEPDVRANIAGSAVTVNTGSGDNSLSLYDVTDRVQWSVG